MTSRSEHWLGLAVRDQTTDLNHAIGQVFGWKDTEEVQWLSPVEGDDYAEYYDEEFLARLGVDKLRVPLHEFWPRSGPRWDGLARTNSGKLLLIEAKAYIEEGVTFESKPGPVSLHRIAAAIASAKKAFNARPEAVWMTPFYQYANRLAHLYFLRELNGLDAHLLFLNFADAPDVPSPVNRAQWEGASRVINCALGLGKHPYQSVVKTLIWNAGPRRSSCASESLSGGV